MKRALLIELYRTCFILFVALLALAGVFALAFGVDIRIDDGCAVVPGRGVQTIPAPEVRK